MRTLRFRVWGRTGPPEVTQQARGKNMPHACLPDPSPVQSLKEGFSTISQIRSWPKCGQWGSGAKGGHNAISRLAIWLRDGGEPRLAAFAARPGGPCVTRDRLPDGQALAWVWVEASEFPVVRANQLSDVVGEEWRSMGSKARPPQRAERQKSMMRKPGFPPRLRAWLPR